MDYKAPAFEFVRITPDLKRARVDDGWLYMVKTGQSDRPRPPVNPSSQKHVDKSDEAIEERRLEYEAELAKWNAWTPTEYWSSPVVVPDGGRHLFLATKYEQLEARLDKVNARVTELVPTLKVEAEKEFRESLKAKIRDPGRFERLADLEGLAFERETTFAPIRDAARRSRFVRLVDGLRAFLDEVSR